MNKIDSHQLNKIVESRFGFSVDFSNMSLEKAYRLATGITESLDKFKKTHGVHGAEKHPKYMEMFMVRESIHRWMGENKTRLLKESAIGKSATILAAKNVSDTFQDLVMKVSKLQNEQIPSLLDSIRDQLGTAQADQYKAQITEIVSGLVENLNQAREGADAAARQLAGEEVAGDMQMAAPEAAPEEPAGEETAPAQPENPRADRGGLSVGTDQFAATDAAAGGTAGLGRERR